MKRLLVIIFFLISLSVVAQTDRDYIRQGNKAFNSKKYSQSEVLYRKALSKKADNSQALYNLGCALMMQNKMEDAVKFFTNAAKCESNKTRKALSFHNIGEILQAGKLYKEAVNAYAEALRNNPNDDETRYNLALCKYLMKKNSNNQNNKNKDKDKDKQGKDKNSQKQNPNEQGKNKDKDKNSDQAKNENIQNQMSKDNAEQLLNAAVQQEKQTQEKLNKNRMQTRSKRLEKNW